MANYTQIFQQYPFLNSTNSSVVSGMDFARGYFGSLPALIQQGNIVAIILGLIIFFIGLVIINKLSTLLLTIIKRAIVFIITLLILYVYIPVFINKILLEGFTTQNLLIGLAGAVICVFAFSIATISLFKHTKKVIKEQGFKPLFITEPKADIEPDEEPFTLRSITKDKGFLNLLTYMTVAQFGVFSSITLAAPNVKVGVTFFIIFLIASFVFIKQSYKNYKKGLLHFGIAIIVGFILSVILGNVWRNHTFSELLSAAYFASDSLIALVTGMVVSLFAGSK